MNNLFKKKRLSIQRWVFLTVFACWHLSSFSIEIYVSVDGSDKNDGSKSFPVATIEKALEISRRHSAENREIIIGDGIYYLKETLVLSHIDSRLTLRAEHEGKAVVSGGSLLTLRWKRKYNKVYCAYIKNVSDIDQLYVNGQRQRMARYPNVSLNDSCNVFDVWNLENRKNDMDAFQEKADALSPSRIATWHNPSGGYIHAMHEYLWGDMHWLIKGKVGRDSLNRVGGWQNNRPASMHPLYRFVENIREELDVPGEWYYDTKKGILYYIPEEGTDMANAKIEIVRLRHLLELRDLQESPVTDVTIRGLVFRHAQRTFMENKEPLLRSDWTIYRGGAVIFRNTEDCRLIDCEFDQVGGNSVFVDSYNRGVLISGCHIHDSGANGIAFVGDSSSVRNPRFTLSDLALTDTIAGPRSDNYPSLCTVYDCLIERTGRDEKQTAPIQISMSYGIHVNHCTIYDVPRAGINISEGTFGGHIIENCDIFNTVLETSDHGSFNSWGRDRYWMKDGSKTSKYLLQHPGAEYWDMLGRNVLHHNRVRCDHGWDIDLDDGSSNYTITDNLLLHGGLKLREGKNRIVTNNIIVNNSFHPHVWYEKSADSFTRNIICGPYRPALMAARLGDDGKWGWQIDFNFFACSKEAMLRYTKNGCDRNSLCGNPLFVNPSVGNYQVATNSDVLHLGFHNFDMNNFGVVSARLKAIAKEPPLPLYEYIPVDEQEMQISYWWNSVHLLKVSGDKASAYGMDLNAVGLSVVSLDEKGSTQKYGLQPNDLIIRINGTSLNGKTDIDQLLSASIKEFTVVRDQETIVVKVKE